MPEIQEYAPLIKLIIIPLWIVIGSFLLEKWIKKIVDLWRRLEDLIVAWNKSSLLLLFLYYIVLIYVKLI